MKRIALALLRWTLFIAVFVIGFTAFLVLCGDSETMRFGTFVAWKAGSIAVIAICIAGGKRLYKRGLFPGIVTRELDRALNERA